MRARLLTFAALLAILLPAQPARRCSAEELETISASVAPLYVGARRIVEGRVLSAERDANVVNLTVGDRAGSITVSLVIGLLSDFPNQPEKYYLDRDVRVVGDITQFRGQVGITVRDPDNIAIAGAVPASAAQPAIDLQRDYDALKDRLRALEQRVGEIAPPASPNPETNE